MNIRSEVFALLDSLNCKYEVRDGIVYVTTPEGVSWDFTIPMKKGEKQDDAFFAELIERFGP